MSPVDRLREHRSGMVADLAFAVAWVTLVSIIFDAVDGPGWAFYMFMLAGIPAYFGFFFSLKMARQQRDE